MIAMALLDDLRALGFELTTDGLAIHVAGPTDKMTPALRDRLAQHKLEMIALIADAMPDEQELMSRCTAACTDLDVDPGELCQWLIAQADPGYMVPAAVRQWAELIDDGGYPSD